MTGGDALILGILQGITEFLPISSSGHLLIGETFLGLPSMTLKSFDVVLHLGTLMAIIFYFWKDGEARPVATQNLARLSKGKMIGVRYNKDKEWVGGSFCWFEK